MLAVVLVEKTKKKKKRGNFQDGTQDKEEQKGQIDLIKAPMYNSSHTEIQAIRLLHLVTFQLHLK